MKGRPDLNTEWVRIYIERDCYLFPFFTFVKGLGQRIKPFLGENLSPLVVHFSDKGVEYFTPLKLIKELGEKAYNQSLNTDFYEKLMELMDQRIFSTLTTCKEIRPNIKTINEKETIEAIKKISEELLQLNPLGQLLAISEYGPNNYISGDLTELISQKSKSMNLKLSASRTSALMTTPIKPTLFRKSSLKLIKLAIFAKKNNYSINDKVLLKKLKDYWYNYLWIDYGYTGPAYSLNDFKEKLEALRLIFMYLQAAISKVETCHEPQKGMSLYNYALKLLNKLSCTNC